MTKNTKKISLFLFLPILLLTLSACGTKNLTNTKNNTNNQPKTTQALTMTNLALHNSATDCWQLINGQVYDLSTYTSSGAHPGGDKILKGCGQDASAMFASIGKHKGKAQAMLADYLLGPIQP